MSDAEFCVAYCVGEGTMSETLRGHGQGTSSLFCVLSLLSMAKSDGPALKVLLTSLIVCPFLRESNVMSVNKDNSIIYIKI